MNATRSCAMTKANPSSGSFRWKAPGNPTKRASQKRASRRGPSSAWDSIHDEMENLRETEGCRVCSNVRRAPSLNLASIATRSPAPNRSGPASCRKRPLSRIPDARSGPLNPFLNVVGALTGSELDDPKVREAVLVKRIFLDDGFDLPSTLADGQDDPAISWYLSARGQ